MILIFLLNVLVHQSGDTLMFMENSEIVERVILNEHVAGDSSRQIVVQQAKVSPNKRRYLVYEAVHNIENDSLLHSKISFHDSEKRNCMKRAPLAQDTFRLSCLTFVIRYLSSHTVIDFIESRRFL